MKRLLTPTMQISLGLLSLTISLIFIAYSFGLIPSGEKAALEARARISENLAVQLANLASRNDTTAIKETIASIVGRKGDVQSIGIRGADGKLLSASDQHKAQWVEPANGKSTSTHVQVPLLDADKPGGKIELVFRPLEADQNLLGLPPTMITFVGFILVSGFAGYYFILRRALRELDPGSAIPERVKAAFDTLAEGVLIMDGRGFILLANDAFIQNLYTGLRPPIGVNASELPWMQAARGGDLPWQLAIRSEHPVLGMPLGISDRTGNIRRLTVNATRIVDAKGVVRGLIATFDDITALHQTNEQLNLSIEQLNAFQVKISEQNQQLKILASSDPLTGCFNRRTFFTEAETMLRHSLQHHQPLSFLMLDVDHFKSINDRFGHVVGDKVLTSLVELLKHSCRSSDLIGRYGGEEFCIAVSGLREDDVMRLAEHIRMSVSNVTTWLPKHGRVTISIGIASLESVPCEIPDLVKRADDALYEAKNTGRNRAVVWREMMPGMDRRVG